MFDADRPIITKEQDRLGRAVFAKYLARCILDHKEKESLVIGLYGSGGVGKTSIINLALEELRFAASNMFDDEQPIILNFSPWSYSGQNQLIYYFFRRLSFALRQAPFLEHAEKIIYLLELYVSFFTNRTVPNVFQPKQSFFSKIFKRNKLEKESLGWESGKDPTQIKAELNQLLGEQQHKIIIVIDNISRLPPQEIKQIFQIIKSMGDFANSVYLLAMDQAQVIHALEKSLESNGMEYLEKIVQLPFTIPPISHQDLEAILMDRLKNIISTLPEETWDIHYWTDLYYSTLKYYFQSPRDITRYINTISFSYPYVKDVVNPVDFFAITAVEIFSPAVFYGIRDNKDLFTDLMDDVYRLDKKNIAEDKARCDEVLRRSEKIPRDKLVQGLIVLFPRLRSLYQPYSPFYHSESIARKNKRICSPDLFDIYFRLSIPTGIIPESEMNAILAIAQDSEGFDLALMRLNKDDRAIQFLDLLDSSGVNRIALENVGNVVNALMDSADLIPDGENSLIGFSTPMRVHRIFHQLLRRFESSDKRFDIFKDAIQKAINSLYIIVHELTMQSLEHNETEDTFLPLEHRDFTPDQLESLKQIAVSRILYWVKIKRLSEHPKLLPILYAWKEWGNEEECKRYVATLVQEGVGLLAFLTSALKEPIEQALTKQEKNPEWIHYLKNVEDFIEIQKLEPYVKRIFEDAEFEKLREKEQLAVLIFLDLTKTKTLKIIPKTTL